MINRLIPFERFHPVSYHFGNSGHIGLFCRDVLLIITGWQLRYRGFTISGQELDALAIVVEALQDREKKDEEISARSQRARQGVMARNANLQSQS